jgi:hypothetical protein
MFTNGFSWSDFTLNCSYTTYDVNYTWASGAIYNTTITPSPNGTLAEMYHGVQNYASVDGGNPVLLDNLRRAGHQNTSDAVAREWANLYSVSVLSTIGAYTTSRTNLQEQTKTSMLVTQVPTLPLGLLLAFGLAYVVLGVWLGIVAYRAATSSAEIWALARGLGHPAIVAAALRSSAGDNDAKVQADIKDDERVMTADKKDWPYTTMTVPA